MESPYRILIIDDDPIYLKVMAAVLESHGYLTESAGDGQEGLEKMRQQPPDLVLLDVMMSWALDGVTVSRQMMEDSKLRRVPLIMVTAIRSTEYSGVFPQDEYLHIDGWLDKPCQPEKLLSEVETVLARHKASRG